MPPPLPSTGVTITNPLVLYRALVATKRLDPDPAQHRLAIHLQKLYEQLKDYEPIVQYKQRLDQISRALSTTTVPHRPNPSQPSSTADSSDDDIPYNQSNGLLRTIFDRRRSKDSLALTRVLTNHEQVLHLDSPRGLMLHGEVGTGKSMLIDLFADCLPNRKKRRWHFTTFMLETFAKLEHLRRSRHVVIPSSLGQQDDYSLLWLARDMISTSPILFLDEFQLPDRAAAKIITNLMTNFFHMGGVLIATSNRMPEELAKAAGVEFTPPPSRLESLGWRFGLGGPGGRRSSSAMYSGTSDFAAFLEVLKARCEVWQMENGKDYRRREAEIDAKEAVSDDAAHRLSTQGFEGLEEMAPGNIGLGYEQSKAVKEESEDEPAASAALPKNFFVRPSDSDTTSSSESFAQSLISAQKAAVGYNAAASDSKVPWETGTMRVYGRNVQVPRQRNGVSSWTFEELCASTLGPADYITLASTYHTLILTDVPVLSVLQKNEARRLITLLDALYEARCKLLVAADAGPDDIFFPESKASSTSAAEETIEQDAILPETISEVYQDATAPFRPNISVYEASSASAPAEPDFTHARLAGLFADDQLEDGPPNAPHRRSSSSDGSVGRGDSIHGLDPSVDALREQLAAQQRRGPDFSQVGVFTGEDEKFAYKRARSRLWEMCGARWWAREGDDWWKPLDRSVRAWEGPSSDAAAAAAADAYSTRIPADSETAGSPRTEGMGAARDIDESRDEVLFRHGASPFRTDAKPPPKFQWTHFWGMMTWGKKAGAWGKGVEGLEEAKVERTRRKTGDKGE